MNSESFESLYIIISYLDRAFFNLVLELLFVCCLYICCLLSVFVLFILVQIVGLFTVINQQNNSQDLESVKFKHHRRF